MAKVDEIKFNVDGEYYKFNINVGKAGIFKVSLDNNVAKKLGITGVLESKDIDNLRQTVYDAVREYNEASKVEEFLIRVTFRTSSDFMDGEHGLNHKFIGDESFAKVPSIAFGYKVFVKETFSTGSEVYYHARKGVKSWDQDESKYYKSNQTWSIEETNSIILPFSDEILDTLDKANAGFTRIATSLFKVMNRPEAGLIKLLTSNKALPFKT